jgi:hypothetical protein
MSGYSMRTKPHSERYGEVIRIVNRITCTDLTIRAKKWFPFGSVGYDEVVDSIAPIKSDGLIFVPEHGRPISVGRQPDHYKWKTAADHTIDFLLRDGELWLERRGVPERASLRVRGHEGVCNGVVECACARTEQGWVATVVRTRPDKTHPNDVRVAELTIQNITENIDLRDMMEF